eukprot:TRINITY_DN741_c0_g2_i1.p1 TRINITY_DN741_c0_g2~~TRINITY_DN741_c0_g2_i1.p1  ORF type:complete len:343 (-),score=117.77 TRINITY_DN741_c0_g2_i1:101-1129(-)
MDEQRRLLDELMGAGRNGEVAKAKHFSDADVCKYFLCGVCPLQLFTNTKADLGHCESTHNDVMKEQYEEEVKKNGYGAYDYEMELLRFLRQIVSDCDRRIARADRRIEASREAQAPDTEKLETMNKAIQKLQEEAEKLGEEGLVDESMEKMEQAEALKQEMDAEQKSGPAPAPLDLPPSVQQTLSAAQLANQQQKLRVCEVCSALLSTQESDLRLADHFGGKMHMGFLTVRTKLAELEALARKHPEITRARGRGPSDELDRSRARDRDRVQRGRERDHGGRDYERDRKRSYGDRERERERERYRERDGRDTERYRERERDRDRYRERDYERRYNDDRPRHRR